MAFRTYTVEQARALLPQIRERAAELIALRADVTEVAAAMNEGRTSPLGGAPEVKGWEARIHEIVEWIVRQGLEPKGLAPLLIDFHSDLGGRPVLLCWLEGETELGWYHEPELGFGGRRPLPGTEG